MKRLSEQAPADHRGPLWAKPALGLKQINLRWKVISNARDALARSDDVQPSPVDG